MEVLQPLIDKGQIKIVAKQNIENWKPDVAQAAMEQILTKTDNKVDAVLAMNDGMSDGVAAALAEQKMLARRALGPGRRRGAAEPDRQGTADGDGVEELVCARAAAGEGGDRAGRGQADRQGGGAVQDEVSGETQPSLLLPPVAITRDNLNSWSTPTGSARRSSARA